MATKQQIDLTKGLIKQGVNTMDAAKRVKGNSVTLDNGDTTVLSDAQKKMQEKNLARQTEPLATETTTTTTPPIKPIAPIEPVQPVEPIKTSEETIPTVTPQDFTKPQEVTDQYEEMRKEAETLKNEEIKKVQEEEAKVITDTKKGFLLGRAKFDEQKAYIKNFDVLSNQYEAITDELTKEMDSKGVITDQTYQSIANKYGITIEEAKNPTSIFKKSEFTEEGLKETGLLGFQEGIEGMKTTNERQKQDIITNLDRVRKDAEYSINQTAENMNRTVQSLEAQGARTGLYRSTAFIENVNNTKQDTLGVIGRMQDSLKNSEIDISTNITRLSEDFTKALSKAESEYKTAEEKTKTETSLALNEARTLYDGEKLLEALNEITETYGLKSQDVMTKYLNNISNINSISSQIIDITQQKAEVQDAEERKKYNEFLSNDGLILQQSSLGDIIESVQNGEMSVTKGENLLKIMQTSIQSTLGAIAPLISSDIQTIDGLLKQGYTPMEVVAKMQEMEKFTPKAEVKFDFREVDGDLYRTDNLGNVTLAVQSKEEAKDWKKLDDGTYVNPDGEIVTKQEIDQQKILENKYLNSNVGDFVGIECGQFARSAVGMSGTPGGNSLEKRIQEFSDTTAVPGGMVLFNGGGYDSTYGHIAVVTGVNQDGTINIKESNLNNDKKVTERTISASDPAISGYYNNTPLTGGKQVDEGTNSIVDGILKGVGSLSDLTATDKREILPILNEKINAQLTDDENRNIILRSATSTKEMSDTQATKMSDMGIVSYQLDRLEQNLSNQSTGPIIGKIKKLYPYDTEGQVALAQLAGLTPKVARGIFGEVGVLTDTDIANYQKALPNLTSTEEKNKFVIQFMRDLLAKGINTTIITQAKNGVNMSRFLPDYDKSLSSVGGTQDSTKSTVTTPTGNTYTW